MTEEERRRLQAAQAAPAPVPVATGFDANGQPVAVPSVVTTTTQPVDDTSRATAWAEPTPEIAKALEDRTAAAKAEKNLVQERTAANVQIEAHEAEGIKQEAEARARYLKEREDLKKANDAEVARLMLEQKQAREDLAATKPGSYLGDMSMPRRFLAALGMGLGTYATAWGVQNTAFEIYKENEKAYREKQEASLTAKAKRLAALTGDIKAARELMVTGQAEILNRERAQMETLKAQTQAYVKRVPQAALAGKEAETKLDKEIAENDLKQANLFMAHVTEGGQHHGERVSTQVTEGRAAAGGAPSAPAVEAHQAALEKKLAMENLATLVEKNPAAWKEYQNAVKQELQNAASEGSTIGRVIQTAQGTGFAPVAIDQRLKTKEARAINAAIAPLVTAKAREMDPIGALNKDAYINASKSLNIVTAPPAELATKAREYGAIAGRQAGALAPLVNRGMPAAPTSIGAVEASGIVPPGGKIGGRPAAGERFAPATRKAPRLSPQQSAERTKLMDYRAKWLGKDPSKVAAADEGLRLLRQSTGGE